MFRSEALADRAERLSGEVATIAPLAWQVIGYLLFGGLATGLLFLALADYARVETVNGAIVPAAGIVPVLPSRAGIISSISVREGESIAAGVVLATVRAEEDTAIGVSAGEGIELAIARQDASLKAQAAAAGASAAALQGQLTAQRAGLEAEIMQIEEQRALQEDLVASAQKDLDRTRTVAARGFVSGRDMQIREETLLSRRQGLSQLSQTLSSRQAALDEVRRNAANQAAQARAQAASIDAARGEVARAAASAAGARSYVLRAPVAGRVTALVARVGQPASAQAPLMTIVPAGSILRAELAVPSAAIGFVKPGQQVRLAIDAFPYQRFGTVKGRVRTVATSAISAQGPNGTTVAVYPVAVALGDASIAAYGRNQPLVSGMTLTARIITEQQSLLEWLFEPLLAVRRR